MKRPTDPCTATPYAQASAKGKPDMSHSTSVVRLVKRRGTKAEHVVVGISVKPGAASREAHFRWSKTRHRLHLQTTTGARKKRSSRDIFIDCMLACVIGVENFRRRCPSEFNYEFTILEGRNLSRDCTVGFSLAAFRAVAAATGFWPDKFDDGLEGYGWAQCSNGKR